jgi:putative ABC transport system permease protein
MRLPILRGRAIDGRDRAGSSPVVVVNDWFAQRHWPNEDAVGKRITLDPGATDPAWVTVVGVVKNAVRSDWAAPPEEEMYLPYLQTRRYLEGEGGHLAYMTLVVRASCERRGPCNPAALAPAVRDAVGSLDRAVPVTEMQTMEEVVAGANARPRLTLVLLATFAIVALVLAAVGIYGLLSFSVVQRRHEIGVRIALGASRSEVLKAVVRDAAVLAAIGVAIGTAAALALTRGMRSLLYGVSAADPAVFLGAAAGLFGVALLAAMLPAWRAARLDPVVALRQE